MSSVTDDEKATATDVYFLPRGESDGEALSDEEKEWQQFVDEMGDAIEYSKLIVSREPTGPDGRPKGRGLAFLFECGVGEHSFSQLCSRLRDDYGSGIYRIQMRRRDGALQKNKRVHIEAPKSQESRTEQTGAGQVISQMSLAMENQQRRFEALMERYQRPQQDPFDQVTQMMAAMGAMMKGLGIQQSPPQPPKTMIETLTEMKMVRELLGDMSDGDSGKVDNFWGAIAKAAESFGGPLMQAITLAQQQGALDRDGIVQPRALAHNPKATPADADPAESEEQREMKQKLAFLCKQADNHVAPADVVAFVLDALPDDDGAVNALYDFLIDPGCLEQCAALHPPVNDNLQWFADWRRLMLSELDKLFIPDPLAGLTGGAATPDDTGAGAGATGAADATSPGDAVNPDGNTERPRGHSGDA